MATTWILVANRVRARLLELADGAPELHEIGDFLNPEGRAPEGSRGDHRPPRSVESVGSARHAIEPHTTPAEKVADRFARQLVRLLEDGRTHHHFDHLVLAATPRFLGRLRHCMDAPLRSCVSAELTHDLTRSSGAAIRRRLRPAAAARPH